MVETKKIKYNMTISVNELTIADFKTFQAKTEELKIAKKVKQ